MTRAERNDSKLFPSGDASVFAGSARDLAIDQNHLTGSRIEAGKLIVPNSLEDKFRVEVGPAEFKGVEYIGAANDDFTGVHSFTLTPHASTAVGDLMVFMSTFDEPDVSMTPGLGWQLIDARFIGTGGGTGAYGIWTKVFEDTDTTWNVACTLDGAFLYGVYSCLTFRNATLTHGPDMGLEKLDEDITDTIQFATQEGAPRGSYAVGYTAWEAGTTRTVTPSSGFTEVFDDNELSGATYFGAHVQIKEIPNEGDIVYGNATASANLQELTGFSFLIRPREAGILGWSGTAGSEEFELNNQGNVKFGSLLGDFSVHGRLRYQVPYVLVCKNGDENFTNSNPAVIAFAGALFDDLGIFDDANDALVFDETRALWEIRLHVSWEGSGTGRRLATIRNNGVDVARSNVEAASSGATTNEVVYMLANTSFDTVVFRGEQNSGGTLACQGDDTQFETHISAKYIRDLP